MCPKHRIIKIIKLNLDRKIFWFVVPKYCLLKSYCVQRLCLFANAHTTHLLIVQSFGQQAATEHLQPNSPPSY